jgi:hypothetical protein
VYNIDDSHYVVSYCSRDTTDLFGDHSHLLSLKGYYCGDLPFEITNSLEINNPNYGQHLTRVSAITSHDGINIYAGGFAGTRTNQNTYVVTSSSKFSWNSYTATTTFSSL